MKLVFKKSLLTFIIMAMFVPVLQAQTVTEVSGIVTDTNGEPMIGVSVVVKEDNRGDMTDENGHYSIKAYSGQTLEFSFIGFKTVKLSILKSKINVVLEEDAVSLDQVVVTGYTETTVRKSTGSVGVVQAKELDNKPLSNIDNLMKGKIAGVNIQASSGRPGAAAKIRIRGASSITGNASPLWVVDGVPLQKEIPTVNSSQVSSGDFNEVFANGIGGINPQDIASITVLKDASASAIYGSRASGGVIVVTTKKGKAGKLSINYSGHASVQTSPTRSDNLMNSSEKLAWEQELYDEFHQTVGAVGMIRNGVGDYSGYSTEEQDAAIAQLGSQSTDWFDELFRTTLSQSHYLSLSGGNDKTTYYISLGYSENNGLVINTDYSRYNINAKISNRPNDRLSFGLITDFSYQKSSSPAASINMFDYAYFANPYEKLYNDDGSYAADNTYFSLNESNGGYSLPLPEDGFNIMREINNTSSEGKSASATLTANLSYKIAKHLNFSGMASFSYSNDNSDTVLGADTYSAFMDRPFETNTLTSMRKYGSISQSTSYNTSYMLRGQLNYSRIFNDIHRISILGGSEIRGNYAKSLFMKRYGYDPVSGNNSTPIYQDNTGGVVNYDKLISFGNTMDGLLGQAITENSYASFYAALDYNLKDKYIANYTIRTDGSNNFGSEEQFNPTWSLGFSWNIDQEPFFESIKNIISSMTIRTSTGYTGGVNKSVYPNFIMNYNSSFRQTEDAFYRMGSISNAPNPHLSWEKTRDAKVAVDLGFLKDRISLLVEAYYRKGIDLVTSVAVPSTTGFTTQSYNTSEQINKGIEVSLSGRIIQSKDISWSASANFAYNLNKLTKYDSPTGSVYGSYYVGYPLGHLFTGKSTGINPDTGIYNYQLRPDAVITDISDLRDTKNYLYYVGTSNAPYTGGFSTSFRYQRLTMSVSGSYSLKGYILNNINSPVGYSTISDAMGSGDLEPIPSQQNDLYVNHLNVSKDVTYRWTEDNPITDGYPRIIDRYGERLYLDRDTPTASTITNASLLENISYLKISSLSLLYSLPDKFVKKASLNSVGLSFSMNNLFTFTDYDGLDPETPGAVYPMSRSYSFGVSIGF